MNDSRNTHTEHNHGNVAAPGVSALWRELSTLADIAPEGQRPGLARARTRLLDGVPAWRLPAVLDALATGRALA